MANTNEDYDLLLQTTLYIQNDLKTAKDTIARLLEEKAALQRENERLRSNTLSLPLFPLNSHVHAPHDGFYGTVIGYYKTLEGHLGVVVQLFNTKVVHVYRERYLEPKFPPSYYGDAAKL